MNTHRPVGLTGATLALLGLLVTWPGSAVASSPSWTADMPPEILSWRVTILEKASYEKLANEWRDYLKRHPESAMADVQLARALRYAGAPIEEQQELIRRAFETDPNCPEALDAICQTALFSSKPMTASLEEGRERGLRAVALAPDWPEPHFTLWSICTILGRHDEAKEHLRSLIAKGGIPSPLLDYGYNTLSSAEPGAVIFTNGDNDTYPPLALQAVQGMRPDVAIVNLSLLQKIEYGLDVWDDALGAKGPFTKAEIRDLHERWQRDMKASREPFTPFSTVVMKALLEKVRDGRWTKPVYLAITVAPQHLEACDRHLEIEGILFRVEKEPKRGDDEEPGIDAARTSELFREGFRLESATDLAYPWSPDSAVRHIMKNYPAVLRVLATDAGERGDRAQVAFALRSAIEILDFHDDQGTVKQLARYWKELDPESREMDPWL